MLAPVRIQLDRRELQMTLYDTVGGSGFVGLKPGTFENWRAAKNPNGPRYIRVGRKIRYREADLLEWLAKRTVDPSATEKPRRRRRAA